MEEKLQFPFDEIAREAAFDRLIKMVRFANGMSCFDEGDVRLKFAGTERFSAEPQKNGMDFTLSFSTCSLMKCFQNLNLWYCRWLSCDLDRYFRISELVVLTPT